MTTTITSVSKVNPRRLEVCISLGGERKTLNETTNKATEREVRFWGEQQTQPHGL